MTKNNQFQTTELTSSEISQYQSPSDHIGAQLEFLFDPGDVFEVTALNCKERKHELWNNEWSQGTTITGYFDDLSIAVAVIQRLDLEVKPESINISLNPVKPELLGRANNRLKANINRTSDKEVIIRKNVLIDIDSVRSSGVSATDSQILEAEKVTDQVIKRVEEINLPEPLKAFSGNGFHLLFKLDPEIKSEKNYVKAFTSAIAEQFTHEHVEIDTTVTNSSRLVKAYGTHARKGDQTPTQPHRLAKVLLAPDTPEPISISFLNQLSEAYKPEAKEEREMVNSAVGNEPRFDLPAYLSHYKVTVLETKKSGTATVHCLETCLFDPSHTPNKASIVVNEDGKLFYQCFKKGCTNHTWNEAREIISGNDKLIPFLKNFDGEYEPIISSQLTALEIIKLELPPVNAMVENLIGQEEATIISGPAGIGKSVLTLNIAMALGSPQIDKLWGLEIQQEVRTLFFQSENGTRAVRNRAQLMSNDQFLFNGTKNVIFPSLGEDEIRVSKGNLADPTFIDILLHHIELSGAQLVVIDPLISFHHGDENDNSEMRRSLDNLTDVISKTKCSFLVIHHVGRIYSGKKTSYAGRGASSAGDWADNNFLLEKIYSTPSNPSQSLRLSNQKSRNAEELDEIELVLDNNLVLHKAAANSKNNASQINGIHVQQALEQLGGKVKKQTELVKELTAITGKSSSSCRKMIIDAITNGQVDSQDDPQNLKNKIYTLP